MKAYKRAPPNGYAFSLHLTVSSPHHAFSLPCRPPKKVFHKVRHEEANLGSPVWRCVSLAGRDLMAKLLCKDPAKRISSQVSRGFFDRG